MQLSALDRLKTVTLSDSTNAAIRKVRGRDLIGI
jgi:hypothetical protein